MAGFADLVGEWAAETQERIDVVYARSVEMLGDELAMTRPMGGRVPFMTGNLARSLLASTTAMPSQGVADATYSGGVGSSLSIITATLTAQEQVWLGYQANYAHRLNYGFVGQDSLGRNINQEGAHFVEYAASLWPTIVALAAEDVRTNAGS